MKYRSLLFFIFSLFFQSIFAGFAAGTLVKVPSGYKLIEDLIVGDLVFSITASGDITLAQITHTKSYIDHHAICFTFETDHVITHPCQKFYLPHENKWKKIRNLCKHRSLLSGCKTPILPENIFHYYQEIEFFDIRVDNHHTFFVSLDDIVVHNFPLLSVGFSIAWGLGKITFETFYLGICFLGAWLGTTLFKDEQKQKPKIKFNITLNSPSGTPQPPDDDECHFGIYENNPKHHQNSRNNISKPPINGQKSLNRSVEVLDKKGKVVGRIAIENDSYVILREHKPGFYHGYITPEGEFHTLRQNCKTALYTNKLISCMKRGKIVK